MATQPKLDKAMFRPASPLPSNVSEEPQEKTPPQQAEPLAQWQDNRGDRLVYVLWIVCFILMAAQTIGNTLIGFLFGHH